MRSRNAFFTQLLPAILLFVPVLIQAQENDPDMPLLSKGLSKMDYLIERQKYYEERQGSVGKFSYNPRLLAIQEMKKKEAAQRNNRTSLILSPSWMQLGPSPIPNGQTTNFTVPVSGRVTCVAVHPANENIVYIGTANGGVYRSMNGGSNWTSIFDNAQSLAIGALALAPSDPSILYVGTGEPQLSADSYHGVGLYRIENADASPALVGPIDPVFTYNNGTTNVVTGTFTFRAISKILVHPTDPGTIFVSTTSAVMGNPNQSAGGGTLPPVGMRGIYRSTNATAAASEIAFTKMTVDPNNCSDVPCTGNINIMDMVLEPGNPNNLICWAYDAISATPTIGGGVYRTTNALAVTPLFTKVYNTGTANVRGELAIAKVDGNVVAYAATGENSGSGRLLRSLDGGFTWTTAPGSTSFCSGQCFYDIALAVDPTNVAKVYIGGSSGSNIFRRSLDTLKTTPVSITSRLHADVHTIAVAPSNTNVIYLGCDGGIFKSVDGAATWASMNSAGLHATQFQSIALHPVNPNFTIGGTQDNGTNMITPAGTFNRIDWGDGGYVAIDQNATDNSNVTMYHTYYNNSTLAGYARVDAVSGASDGNWPFYGCNGGTGSGITCPTTTLFYSPLALGPGNPNVVYYANNLLYRSANKGVTNTIASQTMTSSISSIAISPEDDNIRLVGLTNGSVFATLTGATTLTNVTPSTITRAVGRVVVHPTNKNIAYVCYVGYGIASGQHIWKTTNLNDLGGTGVTWTPSGNGLPDVSVNCMVISAVNPNLLYCGTDIGVFISTDAGANWLPYSTGLPVVPVFDMAIHKVTNVLRIATHGRGFWETAALSPLPVSFTEFTASVKSKTNVLLQWLTATETNNRGFEVQRAAVRGNALQNWETIGFVNGSGTTASPRRYEFEDVPTGGRKFVYRLRQVDFDNNGKLSEQRQVSLADFDFALFPVYPNPVKTVANIRYQLPEDGAATLLIYNNLGVLVKTVFNERKEAGIYQEAVGLGGLAKGTYYVSLKAGLYSNAKSFMIQ